MIDTIDRSGGGSDRVDFLDRPGWIPAHIESDWDPDPYAYITEEEHMPQGQLHHLLICLLAEVLLPHLRSQGIELWMDLFLLYRDDDGLRQRIAPDLMLDLGDQPLNDDSWSLDNRPAPKLVGEITSPSSRKADYETNRKLYQKLGIESYLLIDGLTDKGEQSDTIEVHYWRNDEKVSASDDGYIDIPELQIKITANAEALQFIDRNTGLLLLRQEEKDQALEEKERMIKELQNRLNESS